MSNANQPHRRRRPRRGKKPADLWRDVPEPPAPAPIAPAPDPAALIRSLGDPRLPGQSVVAERYMEAVVERAAALATALAASVGLLSDPVPDPTD